MIKVLMVDDHPVVRKCIAMTINKSSNIRVTDEVNTGEEAIQRAKQSFFDVVIMDLKMPGIGGLKATKEILKRNPQQKILIFTSINDKKSTTKLLQTGASGYICKETGVNELMQAIVAVHAGQQYIDPQLTQFLTSHMAASNHYGQLLLSAKEKQIMRLMLDGHKRQDIASELGLRPKTISSYRDRIFAKLRINDDADLARLSLMGFLN